VARQFSIQIAARPDLSRLPPWCLRPWSGNSASNSNWARAERASFRWMQSFRARGPQGAGLRVDALGRVVLDRAVGAQLPQRVLARDRADRPGVGAHDQRVGGRAARLVTDADHQSAVGNTGGREEVMLLLRFSCVGRSRMTTVMSCGVTPLAFASAAMFSATVRRGRRRWPLPSPLRSPAVPGATPRHAAAHGNPGTLPAAAGLDTQLQSPYRGGTGTRDRCAVPG
jgi:hypothetical protein